LCQRQNELLRLNARVVIISFGTLPALQAWMRETCESFEVLLDPGREVYRAYQLERSRWRSWTPRTLWTYARLLAAGRKWQPKEGDTSQMGADFIIDGQGIIRLAHRSHDPADRPKVDVLLSILEGLQK
jgi:peroxiredoxin